MKFYLLLFASIMLLSFNAKSQSQIHNLQLEFKLDTTIVSIDSENPSEYSASTKHEVVFKITLSDTLNIDKVKITFGTTDGGKELFTYSLNHNGNNLPAEVNVSKENNVIIINAGKYAGISTFYASAKLKYSDGSYSTIIKETNAQ